MCSKPRDKISAFSSSALRGDLLVIFWYILYSYIVNFHLVFVEYLPTLCQVLWTLGVQC